MDQSHHSSHAQAPRYQALGLVLAMALLASQAFADTRVSLRSVVRVPAGAPVTLGQVAIIEGDDAARLAAITIIEDISKSTPNVSGWIDLDIDRIRTALKEQNVRLSSLELRGGSCAILPASATANATSKPLIERTVLTTTPDRTQPKPQTGPMHDLVAQTIATALAVRVQDMRLTYDKRDTEFLTSPLAGRAIDIKPAGLSDRMPLSITVYEDDRIAQSKTIRVGVLVRRNVLIAKRPIRRGETMAGFDFAAETRWLPPTTKPAATADALERVATRSINADQVIETHMVEPPIVIKRGDLTNIHCVSGSILIEMQRMRAKRDGREGETIEFESADGKRRRLMARISGPGQAVIIATGGGA